MTANNPLIEFCHEIISGPGGLHDFEYYEMAIPKRDRDEAIALWVIKCLANPKCDGSDEILSLITERRVHLKDANP